MKFHAPALLLLTCSLASAASQEMRYTRASEGAKIYNLPDVKGKVIAEPRTGSLVSVHREKAAGWVEVEVPGGFPVWVFGRYLKPTQTAGIYEVTGNAVNMRPEPNSEPTSFPLPQRLRSRDQVAVIGRLDESQPMDKTWVRIWSPPGVRGLMKFEELRPLGEAENGAALWSAALESGVKAAPLLPPAGNQAVPPPVADPAQAQAAKSALEAAKRDLETESRRSTPDYGRVRDQLEAILKESSGTVVAVEARALMQRLEKSEQALAMKEELYRLREQVERETLEKQKAAWERSRAIDPLREVFLARGTLERRVGTDGRERFFLRFGLETRAELVCSAQRYNFARFADYEVGVKGTRTGELEPGVERIDVVRLEVLKRR